MITQNLNDLRAVLAKNLTICRLYRYGTSKMFLRCIVFLAATGVSSDAACTSVMDCNAHGRRQIRPLDVLQDKQNGKKKPGKLEVQSNNLV